MMAGFCCDLLKLQKSLYEEEDGEAGDGSHGLQLERKGIDGGVGDPRPVSARWKSTAAKVKKIKKNNNNNKQIKKIEIEVEI
jgi:hypothetical protein